MEITIPSIDECRWDMPPIPRPLYVCRHPEADDCFLPTIAGYGQTREEAYEDFIEAIVEHIACERDKELAHEAH